MAKSPLASVQFFRICEVVELWTPRPRFVTSDIMQAELRRGWYKWTKEKEGVEGFRCGVPLEQDPPEEELPDLDESVDREFLEAFAQKQNWPLPVCLRPSADEQVRRKGRPSIKGAIVQEFERRCAEAEMDGTWRDKARILREWAAREYPGQHIPEVKTIAQQISKAVSAK